MTYKLRDWLFSAALLGRTFPYHFRRNWIGAGSSEDQLPVELPELMDWAPRALDEESELEPPLGRSKTGCMPTMTFTRGLAPTQENSTPCPNGRLMLVLPPVPRPDNEEHFVDSAVERYWMTSGDGGIGGVDLYVGGVEHAVLHLLYSRFWHKVLYDLGHVSGPEPFQRLYNQGYIQAAAYQDDRGIYVDAEKVIEKDGVFLFDGQPVSRSFGKMGKSLKNSVTPDDMYSAYGADTLGSMKCSWTVGQDRPWNVGSWFAPSTAESVAQPY